MPISLPDAVRMANAYAPRYDRSAVTPGIVHIGVGGFHRSHQAVYIDDLLVRGLARDWGICGVGLLDRDRAMCDALADQDNLYTVLVKNNDGTIHPRVVGALVEYLFAPERPETVLERLAAASTRIVTLTITEGGYNLEPATGEFVDDDPLIAAEVAGRGAPRTHFRFLLEALRRRRDRGIAPFTVASCDNIQGNGVVARRTLIRYAELVDPEFARWIDENVHFPNSMVDRITPITTDEDRALVRERFGLDDAWPVPCEPYQQWVLEDDFPLGRPPLEEVGVQLVPDVEPYEMMKLRLLNASHQMIGYVSFLEGYEYVHEAMSDPLIREFVARFMKREAQPTLPDLPGIDLADYRATLLERFSNPLVRDTIARQCLQTSTTIPTFLLPIIRDQLDSGRGIDLAATTIAAWACYAAEPGDDRIVDRWREKLVERARDSVNPYAFVEDEALFGDLATNEQFRDAYRTAHQSFRDRGVADTLRAALKGYSVPDGVAP
ncbi:mannitol dehydrogenase family protein [Rhodococcus opacus]|uniref:mannitol dehydrogenase family protein n=1 Tax=Rhodococcus opacus TaxID=37919 RepID=UPI001C44B6FC|nr:mannitol dehydrogenase family protein [Rhodococcus opacus]MBV6760392.1 mannitol dehydrogenase family protein [Rhodococcus opacus]